jgi:pimeloyl-ACP methyl ester carboxylesterase
MVHMPFADVHGVRLFYTDQGEGSPVLLVHGFTCDSHDWMYQQPALGGKHRVIAVDLRGHGHSSVPDDGYNPRQYAADLAALLEQLGTGPVVAVGHSMGGATVVALAVEHPERVRAVVPVDAAYGGGGDSESFRALVAALGGENGHDAAARLFANFYHPATPPHLQHWHTRRIYAVAPHVLPLAMGGMVIGEDSFSAKPDAEAYLQRITCPALAFRGGNQDPASVAAWEKAQFQHPYSHAIGWEGSGHFLHQERPREFNAILTRWIDGLPS